MAGELFCEIRVVISVSGSCIALKQLYKEDHLFEKDIVTRSSSDPLSKDSRNTVHLLDVPHPPLVMPFLRPFNLPVFDTFG